LLSTATLPAAATEEADARRRKSLILVFFCTLIGAVSQVLIKTGATMLAHQVAHPSLLSAATGMFTNPWLFSGYAFYGVSAVLMVLALRDGQLSMLYPVIALTYVWVTLLSFVIFHESIGGYKVGGIALIVAGVGVLGLKGNK
jgi:multidrug transporter EmrE-like cation transporter